MPVWLGHSLRQAQGRLCPSLTGKRMRVPMMLVLVSMTIARVFVRKRMNLLPPLPILFPRQILFSVHPHIHLRRCNPTADNPRNFQPSPDAQRRHSPFQHHSRNPGIDQRAQKHIAAHARKTFKVGNAHRSQFTTEPRVQREVPGFSPCLLASVVGFALIFHHRERCTLRQTRPHGALC
jgi:hypothetical protein